MDHGTRHGWESDDWRNPTFEDYEHNGLYCKTGIAFPVDENTARCTTADKIMFKNEKLEFPYQCDPTDNNEQCSIVFNTTDYIAGFE